LLFIDTSFILGLSVNNDQWYDDALNLFPKVEKSKRYISNVIILETLNGLVGIMDGKEIEKMYNLLNNHYNDMVDKEIQNSYYPTDFPAHSPYNTILQLQSHIHKNKQ
jgi:predicted nucleic acid-binding protein